jgi:hypothetical protein
VCVCGGGGGGGGRVLKMNLNRTRIKTKGICKTHKVWLRPKLTGKYNQKKGYLG